jgi:hypothetical protein
MQRSALALCLLLLSLLCCRAKSNDTLDLPRKNAPVTPFIVKGNQILTDHYHITAFRRDDGNLAGERLEHLFDVWQLLFTEFLKDKDAEKEPAKHRHQVVLHRDKHAYTSSLKRFDPFIAQTNGYYFAPTKTAHFFSLEDKILFHEGTHQILAEHFFSKSSQTFRNNFWLVEGIALFMQTLRVEEKSYKIGDILADRLYGAKIYRVRENHNLPIRKLTAMSRAEIQTNADLQKIYSQSAALVHWLMFAEEGRYRKHLFELLRRTYLDSAKPETLSELTGLSYEELDKKYVEFLDTIPDEP